jgi:hypothetical protein
VITIALQGRRIWTQEQELSSERAGEIREQMALDIGQEIVTRLERIKRQEMANKPSGNLKGGAVFRSLLSPTQRSALLAK